MDDSCEELEAEAEYYAEKSEREWDYWEKVRAQQRKAELAMYQSCSQMGSTKKKRIGIVCTEEQYKTIKRLALENDTNMSDYILKKLFGKVKTKKHIDWEEEPTIDYYDDNEFQTSFRGLNYEEY